MRDRRGDDEPAGRRAVGGENHRQIAVDVDRSDRVGVVEDVRRVAACDAAGALLMVIEPA